MNIIYPLGKKKYAKKFNVIHPDLKIGDEVKVKTFSGYHIGKIKKCLCGEYTTLYLIEGLVGWFRRGDITRSK